MIEDLCSITGADKATALSFLEMADYNLEIAVDLYFQMMSNSQQVEQLTTTQTPVTTTTPTTTVTSTTTTTDTTAATTTTTSTVTVINLDSDDEEEEEKYEVVEEIVVVEEDSNLESAFDLAFDNSRTSSDMGAFASISKPFSPDDYKNAFLPPPNEVSALEWLTEKQAAAMRYVVTKSKKAATAVHSKLLSRVTNLGFSESQLNQTFLYIPTYS